MALFSRKNLADTVPEHAHSVALGAYYFAPGWPSRDMWESDLENIRASGLTHVTAVAVWGAIAAHEDRLEWEPLDAFITAAASRGLSVHLSLVLESAPEWLIATHPSWLYVNNNGDALRPYARARFYYGGWPGVCFDHAGARDAAYPFLHGLAQRAAASDHVTAIEVWPGVALPAAFHACRPGERYCYCSATEKSFVAWLQETYADDIEALNTQWMRHFTQWEHVTAPRWYTTFPDNVDWLRFLAQRQSTHLAWRCETVREAGFSGELRAHSGLGHALYPARGCDDYACARHVDAWGYTNEEVTEDKEQVFRLYFGADMARSAAKDKKVHLSQLRIGPFTSESLQRESGHSAAFVRMNTYIGFATGAEEITYRAWRPQITGHDADGYGLTLIDGSCNARTDTVRMCAERIRTYDTLPSLSAPGADVALLFLPDALRFNCVAEKGDTTYYRHAILGAYQAFFAENITVDIVQPEALSSYRVAYMPWPLALSAEDAEHLRAYVHAGGTLVSEASPGRYSPHGFRSTTVPAHGLEEVFGCKEIGIADFLSSGAKAPVISTEKAHYPCAHIQAYLAPETGRACGKYLSGECALVESAYGQGRTRLIATSPSIAYYERHDTRAADFITSSLAYAGVKPHISTDARSVHVRRLVAEDTTLLLLVNMTQVPAHISLNHTEAKVPYKTVYNHMTEERSTVRKAPRSYTVQAHDMVVLELRT